MGIYQALSILLSCYDFYSLSCNTKIVDIGHKIKIFTISVLN